jgi:pimeloyl-ACP methyl ester carboxylesterase
MRLRSAPLVLLTVLALLPSVASAQDDEKGDRVRFATADEVELHGTFYSGTRRSPAVLLLHTLGEERSSRPWKGLAEHLHKAGYAVLSFDFRGHGKSTTVDPQVFWSPRFMTNRNLVRGAGSEEISFRDFDKRYHAALVNDIAAAKAYLDRKNDQGECDTSNLIVVGAETGATLGAVWMNAEWHRHRLQPAPFFGAPAQLHIDPEGRNLLCGVWLSISPELGGRTISLSGTLDLPGRQKKVPMVFLFGKRDAEGRSVARALERGLKYNQRLPFTAAVEIPGAGDLTGEKLLQANETAYQAIQDYLDGVHEAEGREWTQFEVREASYVWRTPRTGALVPANPMGTNTPFYNTYESFVAYR